MLKAPDQVTAPKKVALITGASSGVGWMTATRLAEEGYDVCVFARRTEPLMRLAGEVRARGGECLVVPGDVTKDEDVRHAVQSCLDRFGRLDVLVNNAAVQVYADFEKYSWEEIERITDVNFYGYLRFARAVLPCFREQGRGTIVNSLSVMAEGGLQLFSIYAATKHALLGWSKCLKLELDGSGVFVTNVILPALNTHLYDHCISKTGHAPKPLPPIYDTKLAARAILRAIRKPDRIKHTPAFLHGQLILWTDYFLPRIGRKIESRIGYSWQKRPERVPPNRGNLWEPIAEGVGPYGTLRATPAYLRYAPLAATVGVALGVAAWAGARAKKAA